MELFGVVDQIGGVDWYAAAVWRGAVVVAQGLLQSCRQSMRLTVKGKAQDGRAVGETRGLVGLVGLLQTPPPCLGRLFLLRNHRPSSLCNATRNFDYPLALINNLVLTPNSTHSFFTLLLFLLVSRFLCVFLSSSAGRLLHSLSRLLVFPFTPSCSRRPLKRTTTLPPLPSAPTCFTSHIQPPELITALPKDKGVRVKTSLSPLSCSSEIATPQHPEQRHSILRPWNLPSPTVRLRFPLPLIHQPRCSILTFCFQCILMWKRLCIACSSATASTALEPHLLAPRAQTARSAH